MVRKAIEPSKKSKEGRGEKIIIIIIDAYD